MANIHHLSLVLCTTILLFLHPVAINAGSGIIVQGRVYCDTCRAGFETSASTYIEGAEVKLECKSFGSNKVVFTAKGVTDKSGTYNIKVDGDHQEEVCEVVLLHSPNSRCSEVTEGRDKMPVLITNNGGMATNVVQVNPLGFMHSQLMHNCGSVLQQYALGVDG